MTSETPKNKIATSAKFVLKVAAIHVFTYIVCGMIFSVLFNYRELFALDNAVYFYRQDLGSIALGPAIQIIRGIFFGLVLLLLRDSYENKKYGWLRLWLIIAVIGIINTPAAAPCSIEGLIYSQLPMKVHINGMPEILTQTLLFSLMVAAPDRKLNMPDRWRKALITAAIAAVGFALGGIILALFLGKNPMEAGFSDPVAFIVMFVAIITVCLITLWYLKHKGTATSIIYYIACYAALAALPTAYNALVDSELQSYWSLLISALPLPFIAAYLKSVKNKENKQ